MHTLRTHAHLRTLDMQGRRLLRQWFLRPVVQLDVVSGRHDTLELLVAAPTTNDALRASMKKVGRWWPHHQRMFGGIGLGLACQLSRAVSRAKHPQCIYFAMVV